MRRKRPRIFVLSVKPGAVLRLLKKYGYQNTCAPKYDFSLSLFSLN